MARTTIARLTDIEMICDPWDFTSYLPEAKQLHLNRVHWPFWQDWPLVEPLLFLTPEPLHHWHKMFWDHNLKWCVCAVGGTKIDFCFSILQPHVGFHHFAEGISNLKQVTGHDHCNVQRYTVGVIAGAVPQDFLLEYSQLEQLISASRKKMRCVSKLIRLLNECHMISKHSYMQK